jgi:hypothetical protein
MAPVTNGRQNGLFTYDYFSGNKKQEDSHFLWWCAGAHQKLLKDYPSEHTKYAGLGGVIVATFILASLSAGYAIYSVFDNLIWASVFAMVWGLIIFNFDRFLVSTMRKYGFSHRKQLALAIPRIILALLIGITIARPLELKIFEKEINVKMAENQHKKMLLNDSLLKLENKSVVTAAELERSRLMQRKISIEDTLHRLEEAYLKEADGTGGSLHRGIEKLTKLKQDAYNSALLQFSPELGQLNQQLLYQDSILNYSSARLQEKRGIYEAGIHSQTGFLDRNKALTDLSNQESSVFIASLFISLLLILIETGPVLSKLLMSVGPYDVALAKTELLQMAASESEMRKEKHLSFDKMDDLYRRKREVSDEMLDKFTSMQKKNMEVELEKWDRGEKSNGSKLPMNELLKKMKEQYDYMEENVL